MTTKIATRDHVVLAALSLFTVGGLYVDGWAHTNGRVDDTFFTPWHALFYSGFAASAAWLLLLAVRLGGRANGWRAWWAALPRPYQLAVYGLGIFAAGGAGDMFWHQVFGFEAGVDALLSPTHLILLLGGMLLFSAPAAVGPTSAAIISTAAIGGVAAFFMSYLNVFVYGYAQHRYVPQADERWAVLGAGGYLLTTAAILVPILLLRRRFATVPSGALTVVTAVVAVGGASQTEFRFWLPMLTAIAGAAVAEVLLRLAGSRVDGWLALGALAPMCIWAAQLAGIEFSEGVLWTPELWAGVVVLTAMAGLSVALLTRPPVNG